jgi:hypothetical protein
MRKNLSDRPPLRFALVHLPQHLDKFLQPLIMADLFVLIRRRLRQQQEWCALQGLNLQKSGDSLANPHTASQIDSQTSGVPADLQRVIDSWGRLSVPLRQAVLAIIGTVNEGKGQ